MLLKFIQNHKSGALAMLTALFCFLVIFLTLNVPEPVGLANNGDFTRIIVPNRIGYIDGDDRKYDSYVPDYEMHFVDGGRVTKLAGLLISDYSLYDYVTSQSLLIKASKLLNLGANLVTGRPASAYSLFWLGLIYTAIYAFAIYLIARFLHRRLGLLPYILGSLAMLFIFCDEGYTLYFHSFYGEAMQIVFTALVIGLFLLLLDRHWAEKDRPAEYIAYYLAVILMAASKNAYVPMGMLFALLPLIFLRRPLARHRGNILIGAATAISFVALTYTLSLTPAWIDADTTFNAVFAGVLQFSDTPERDLEDLGLDPDLAPLQGYQTYMDNYPIDIDTPQFQARFYDRTGKLDIGLFYLTHPGRLVQALEYSGNYTDYIRPWYLGNRQTPTEPKEQSYRFSLWETFRVWSGVHRLPVIMTVFGLALALCLWLLVKKRGRMVPFAFLLGVALLSSAFNLAIPYMTNGICDIAKHLFSHIHFYDMLLVMLAGYLVWAVQKKWTIRAETI